MLVINSGTTGFSFQINIENTDSHKAIADGNLESVKKEHTNEHSSGQPPSKVEKTYPTKLFPSHLVLVLALVLAVLVIAFACLIVDAEAFNSFIDFLKKIISCLPK